MSRQNLLIVGLIAAMAFAVLAVPAPAGADQQVMTAIALTLFTIGLWATGALPEHLTAIAFFVLAMIFSVAPPSVVFSGFQSSAFWLLFGGMIIGAAADHTGLGRYLGHTFVRRIGQSYPRSIAGIVLSMMLLAFIIPTALGRLVLLMPIVLGLAERLGFTAGSKGRTGMVVALSLSSFLMPSAILPANVPNAIMVGAADALYGLKITYGTYLVMHFPITGMIKALLLIVLVLILFPDRVAVHGKHEGERLELGSEGRRLAVILGLTLITWATDFLHGISPGWVAAAAGLACLMPGIGVLPQEKFRGGMNLEALLFIAAILGLGAMVASSGAGKMAADRILAITSFTPDDPGYTYAVFSAISIVMGLVATLPGTIVVLAPFAGDVVRDSGIPLMTVMMVLVNGFSTLFFPYQAAPIVVGLRLGGAAIVDAVRIMVPMAVITMVLLLPGNFFWWRLLGYMP